MNVDLERKLRHLRLGGFVEALPVRTQEAVHNHLAHVEFLELLVEDELARRRQFLFQRRLKQAQLPQLRTIEGFDWDFNPKLPKALILDLATLRFIPERSGALILGAAGLGKSHICIGIAMRAIRGRLHRPLPLPLRSRRGPRRGRCHRHPQGAHRTSKRSRPSHPGRPRRTPPAGHRR